jgi:predicted alpha/beta superfamily hydrolase
MPKLRLATLVCASSIVSAFLAGPLLSQTQSPPSAAKPDNFHAESSAKDQAKPAPAPAAESLIPKGEHTVVGWLDVIPFTSKTFHNTRMLRVWVPGNYLSPHNAHRYYPVLYMQDGQNLFDEATTTGAGEWHLDETLDHLIGSFQVGQMFVVGIDSVADPGRSVEYLPYADSKNAKSGAPNEPSVQGKEYAKMLMTEVMPFIEKRYRVARGAANTGIGGSSYGATISLFIALHDSGSFGKALIESPILGVGDKQLLRDAQVAKSLPQRMYIGIGTNEGPDSTPGTALVQDVRELESILRAKGMGPARLKVRVEEGGTHNEGAWSRRLSDALLFLYGK